MAQNKALIEKERLRKETMEEALASKDFYSPRKALEKDGDFTVVWGQRSNGKSYGFLKYALETFRDTRRTFVYVRRWDEDISTKNMDKLMSPLPIQEIFGDEATVSYAKGAFWLRTGDSDAVPECLGWAVSLNAVAHTKSQTFVGVKIIILDEFLQLSNERHMKSEFDAWEQTLSTILRTTQDARIILIGNSIGKYSCYFSPYGIDPNGIKQGEIKTILLPNEYGEPTKVVAEYCEYNEKIGRRTSKYVRGSQMAKTGEWETKPVANIPHTANEVATEKLVCSMYDPTMNLTMGIFLRTAEWTTLEAVDGIYTAKKHARQFLVIRQTTKQSSYYHLTTVKDLTYTRWLDVNLMFADIKENEDIDIPNELRMGRVYAEDSFTADYFYHTYVNFLNVSTRDLL